MRTSMIKLLAIATFVFAMCLSVRARAEGCPDDSDAEKKQGKFHIEYINGKPVTVIDTVVSVCGKVPRPSVVYVLTVKNIDYEWENLKQDFMPLILATVKKAPF
jgi:hypothetical protein